MQGERIQRRNTIRQRSVPGDLLCFGDQIQRSGRQGRHVQGLANVAGSFRPTGVLMDERSASGEIQHGQAA
jgi:hypothetical protein